MNRLAVIALWIAVLPSLAPAQAQQGNDDPLKANLFPVEVVMQNQQALAVTGEQKAFFRTEVSKAQAFFTDQQWKLQDEMEKLGSKLKVPGADEQQVLSQLDKVLALEREIKRAHVSLLLRIKNRLTAEQQARLREIQNRQAPK